MIGSASEFASFWFKTMQEIPNGQDEIVQGRACRAGAYETPRGRGHARKQGHQTSEFLQAPREIQILETVHRSKAAEPKKEVAPDEHRLIAEMPAD